MSKQDKAVTSEAFTQAGLPEVFLAQHAAGYEGYAEPKQKVLHFCKEMKNSASFKRSGHNLFFRGPRLSWKTYLGTYIGVEALMLDLNVRYLTMPELVEGVFDRSLKHVELRKPDLFFLDELVSENNAFFATALGRFITARKDSGKLTLFASRLSDETLLAVYGEDNCDYLLNHSTIVTCAMKPSHEQRRKARLTLSTHD